MREEVTAKPALFGASMVLTAFGTYLLINWSTLLFGRSLPTHGCIALIAAVLIGLALRGLIHSRSALVIDDVAVRSQKRRSFVIIFVIEVLAIFLAAKLLTQSGHAEWIRAAIVFIVGVHFLPLARVFQHTPYIFTGAALVAIAVVIPLIADHGPLNPGLFLGAALVLWSTAVHCLWVNRNLSTH